MSTRQQSLQDFQPDTTPSGEGGRDDWPPFEAFGPTSRHPIPEPDGVLAERGPHAVDVRALPGTGLTPFDLAVRGVRLSDGTHVHPDDRADCPPRAGVNVSAIARDLAAQQEATEA